MAENMKINTIPFWEEAYKDQKTLAFGSEPNQSILQIEEELAMNAPIIDVGCGDGTNVLYLAKRQFSHVEGVDCSENGINKLNNLSQKEGLHIKTRVADLRNLEFDKNYGLIMSFGTLHFVSKEDWHLFIEKAKKATEVGGFHIMHIFTNKVPASFEIAPFAIGLAEEGELKELYQDWEMIDFKSYVFEDEHPGVPKHLHASNKIIARRVR